jgi:GT2 family glycosyltransferase
MLRIVVATRMDAKEFVQRSPLAASVNRIAVASPVRIDLRASNKLGLSQVYNVALAEAENDETILFVHDDVWIDDWQMPARLADALEKYDVVGLAGNRRRLPKQGAWPFTDLLRTWDTEWLSGAVSHGEGKVSVYGPTPSPVKLLDGLFLAAKVSTLRTAGVSFDPQFAFHFYDLDFCRTCEDAGLTMGTWPIAVNHASGGSFGTPEWYAAYERYLVKWGE